MSLKEVFSYYGSLENASPFRPFYQDIIKEVKLYMLKEFKEMEDRLKRHITECKREIIRKLNAVEPESKKQPKEKVNGSKNK